MTNEIEQLARRAVACPGWRWMPGMVATDGCRVVSKDGDGFQVEAPHDRRCTCPDARSRDDERAVPDLTDPATLGCLLALVREAWAVPNAFAYPCAHGGWGVSLNPGWIDGPTEAEALVAALEAAPAREVKS